MREKNEDGKHRSELKCKMIGPVVAGLLFFEFLIKRSYYADFRPAIKRADNFLG